MSEKYDKKVFGKWLLNNAQKLQHGIVQGAQKAQEISQTVNQKIESSPTAKAARDFILEQGEKVSDVRIGHTRIGDLPNAALRLSQRQLFKLINKMRSVDPDFNWEAYLPSAAELPIFDAFDTLGLPYGTPWEDVKKTYRRLMRQYHPDRHSETPESERRATMKTQEITTAYELIQQHYGK